MVQKRPRFSCGGIGCLVILAVNSTIGGLCFDYCLWKLFSIDAPWYADAICGLIGGEVVIPLALILMILGLCGVNLPQR